MDEADISSCFDTVLLFVREAGEVIKKAFLEKKSVQIKSCEVDLVTETDQKVEALLIERIQNAYPTHKFIGEESVAQGEKCDLTAEPTWIIDPVDGTMNFVHSFPYSCISIALLLDRTPKIGIIYNPVLDQLYSAVAGKGATLNGAKISVSGETDLNKSLLIAELGTSRDPKKMENVLHNIQALMPKVHGIRSMGSCALDMASVASGGADCYFEFGIHAWDIAAGDLIVREAGGICIDTEGGPLDLMSRRMICASSMALAQQVIPLLAQMKLERD